MFKALNNAGLNFRRRIIIHKPNRDQKTITEGRHAKTDKESHRVAFCSLQPLISIQNPPHSKSSAK